MQLLTRLLPAVFLLIGSVFSLSANQPLMPVSEVRRGMSGYGLTVFQGTTIERFDAEIIGVLQNTGASSDLILARLRSEELDKTGLIRGMSGSPVYIDGKLIGAVAYAWGFAKETIAGITPIQEMLDVFRYDGKTQPAPFRMEAPGDTKLHGQTVAQSDHSFRRVETPLIISGVSPALFGILSEKMQEYGFLPVLGGQAGASLKEECPGTLEPGSAIGVQLVNGDMDLTGIGTVTYVGKEGVLAFGHPMMMRGNSSFPMTTAYIHTVMPSLNISFKLGSALNRVGAINQDRQPAIAGQFGAHADMVPVSVAFDIDTRSHAYSFNIIRDTQLFPRLLASVMIKTLSEQSAEQDLVSYTLEYRFTIKETDSGKTHTVEVSDAYASFESAKGYQAGLESIVQQITVSLFNRFESIVLEKVEVTVKAVTDIRAIEISDLQTDAKKVRPGDTVNLRVQLTPWQGTPFWKNVSITVPETTVNDRIFFVVSSQAHERYYDYFFAPAKYQPLSLEQMVKVLNFKRDPTELVLWSELYQTGLIVNGRELPNLPSSVFKNYADSSARSLGALNARLSRSYKTNYYLYGLRVVVLDMDYSSFK